MAKKKKELLTSDRIKEIYAMLKKSKLKISSINIIKENELFCLPILNEALTHTSTNSASNHERLEFLGDAVLRLAASEFIEKNFPNMKVGERSALRSQLVSDKWLTTVGEEISIEKIITTGRKASQDSSAKETLQAEATEAIIGALYECLKDIEVIKNWLTPFWIKESQKVLSDPNKNNSKSALQEWTQAKGLSLPKYITKEICQEHNNPKRFICIVHIKNNPISEGWGKSRKEAEKEAARSAMEYLNKSK